MRHYLVIDTETTGVDFSSSQVIECAVIFLDEKMQPTGRREWLVNYKPETFSWSDKAAEVHGFEKKAAQTHGLEPEKFLKEFEQEIIKRYGSGAERHVHIIAINAYFDYLMLHLLWDTYRKGEPFVLSRRVVDLSSLSLFVVGDVGTSTILEMLGIPTDEEKRHSAMYDAELHLKIFYSLSSVAKQEGLSLL